MNVDSTKVIQLAAAAANSEDKAEVRNIATELGITSSGNTGIDTLKGKIAEMAGSLMQHNENPLPEVNEDDPIVKALRQKQAEEAAAVSPKKPEKQYSLIQLREMNPRQPGIPEHLKRAIIKAKAMELIRCRVNNIDPADAQLNGAIFTVYNKYTGKVSKYIPFGDENEHGWHIPRILLNELKSRVFVQRKEVTKPGGNFGVKQYRTILQKKFAIEILPPLTNEELSALAQDQKARGAIDQTI